MRNKILPIVLILSFSVILVSACNLPQRQSQPSPTPIVNTLLESSPTPTSLCAIPNFPDTMGNKWEYTGTNSVEGDYTRTDSITNSASQSFTLETTQSGVTYSVPYDCTPSGLTSQNPIEQYAGALLSSPNSPVEVKLTSNIGTSLPAKINLGDTWQQTADFEASSKELNLNGRFVFDYSAAGYENVTVLAGTYYAMRVNGTISIEVTGLHVLAGTYRIISWWVSGVGLVKSVGTSNVTGVDFTDSMQLANFIPAP